MLQQKRQLDLKRREYKTQQQDAEKTLERFENKLQIRLTQQLAQLAKEKESSQVSCYTHPLPFMCSLFVLSI